MDLNIAANRLCMRHLQAVEIMQEPTESLGLIHAKVEQSMQTRKWNNRCKPGNQKDAHLYVRTCMRTLIMKFTANEMH